jgi:glycosyltransferase involved in cell wall biosynthesis
MLKVALVTNHPPPFRIPIYEKIGEIPEVDLQLIFCSAREPNRQWELPPLEFNHTFLKERFVRRGDNFIHNNPDVISVLKQLQPDAIVTTGFNPTFLYAFGFAVAKGIPHVPMTDGTDTSEQTLSGWHKTVRRLVYSRSQAFISASDGGRRLYESYGIPAERCFQSCLCIDNDAYLQTREPQEKRFDFIFCGRIVQNKNPLFAISVAAEVARTLARRISILFVGDGEHEEAVKAEAARQSHLVDMEFNGHAAQEELPALYRSARIFLFPTLHDAWGVVANEACAAGLPIIVSPHAGVAGELVINGENGFVCGLDVNVWAQRAALMLTQDALYQRFSRRGHALVNQYTFDHAATGIVDACRYAAGERTAKRLNENARKVG